MGKATITPKENFMRLRHGGMPEYVPFYSIMGDPYKGESAVAGTFAPLFESTLFQPGGGRDAWGVPYTAPENLAAGMPDTSVITLEDISQWTKVLKFPTPTGIDLERVYQDTLKRVDRSQTALKVGPDLNPFQELAALMGFEGALLALIVLLSFEADSDREKIREDLYKKSGYCSVTNYEIDQVLELIKFWGEEYYNAIDRVAEMMMQY